MVRVKHGPDDPTPGEVQLYCAGDAKDRRLALTLYRDRRDVSLTTAEDRLRAHLAELGFKALPPIAIPREN